MTSGFYKYSQLVIKSTNYSKRMNRLSGRIFGEVARPTDSSSMKVVELMKKQPLDQVHDFVNYYPKHKQLSSLMLTLRAHGLYRDEHEDFKEEMKRLRRLRGKGTPKKGEGKRAKKST